MRTAQQEVIYREFMAGMFDEMITCHNKAVKALEAWYDLPYSENGVPVMFKDNMDMRRVAEYYVTRRDKAMIFLPRSVVYEWCKVNQIATGRPPFGTVNPIRPEK